MSSAATAGDDYSFVLTIPYHTPCGNSRLASKAKAKAVSSSQDGHLRAEEKTKATAMSMYRECTFAPNTGGTKAFTDKILAAKGKQASSGRVGLQWVSGAALYLSLIHI